MTFDRQILFNVIVSVKLLTSKADVRDLWACKFLEEGSVSDDRRALAVFLSNVLVACTFDVVEPTIVVLS